jgi:hypothetical protein
MTPSPCHCGATPELTERTLDGTPTVQVQCACGEHGALVFYRKPSDAERTRWAVVDGWNLEMAGRASS